MLLLNGWATESWRGMGSEARFRGAIGRVKSACIERISTPVDSGSEPKPTSLPRFEFQVRRQDSPRLRRDGASARYQSRVRTETGLWFENPT